MHQDGRGVFGKGIHVESVLVLVCRPWLLVAVRVSSLVRRIARCRVRIVFEGRASGAASGQGSFRKGAQGAAGSEWRKRMARNNRRGLLAGSCCRGSAWRSRSDAMHAINWIRSEPGATYVVWRLIRTHERSGAHVASGAEGDRVVSCRWLDCDAGPGRGFEAHATERVGVQRWPEWKRGGARDEGACPGWWRELQQRARGRRRHGVEGFGSGRGGRGPRD